MNSRSDAVPAVSKLQAMISRRSVICGLSASACSFFLLACGGNDDAAGPAVQAAVSSDSTLKDAGPDGTVVPASFFGMHFSSARYQPWPAVKFQTLRTWDQWPGVSWTDLNPSKGVFNWYNLDTVVNEAVSHGVDVVYTFGYVPTWASSNPGGACRDAPAGSCYAPDDTAWRTFVRQITSRYKGRIKYWEMWNEPNARNFWQGSTAQLVAMASGAYSIVRDSGGVMLSPAPQGTNAHLWLESYFAAGGAAFTDIVSFHGYLYGAPERIVPLVAKLRSVMAKSGLNGEQLWDTEHSWGNASWPFGETTDERAAWLARYIALSFSSEISRSIWYMYDSKTWGTLADQQTKQMQSPSIAYRQIYKWMIGARVGTCALSGKIYQCRLTRTGSYEALMVWNVETMDRRTSNFSVPSGYKQYRTLDGNVVPVAPGARIPIGMKPILVEKLN